MSNYIKLAVLVLIGSNVYVKSDATDSIDLSEYNFVPDYSLVPPFESIDSLTDWSFRGLARTMTDKIALVPPRYSYRGSIWNKLPVHSNDWQIELVYTAYSDQEKIADGMALWFVPSVPCEVNHHDSYGGPGPAFVGLMIGIDPYYAMFAEKEALQRKLEESAIIVVNNEKSRVYNISSEGHGIWSGRCVVNNRYRNTTDTISTLKVQYKNNILTVLHKQGDKPYVLCTEVRQLNLLERGHFGISATTGGIWGTFDVHSFRYYQHKNTGKDVHTKTMAIIKSNEENLTKTVKALIIIIIILSVAMLGVTIMYGIKIQRDRKTKKAITTFNGISNHFSVDQDTNGLLVA